MIETLPLLQNTSFPQIKRANLETLQVNLGYKCNQQCLHCHVNAGPNRKELMQFDTIQSVISFLEQTSVTTLDLTGGAPEMNPNFKYLVTEARRLGIHVMDRCNLTILNEPGYEGLADFFAENQVEITASLPCYEQDNVDKQRGKGVFESSLTGLSKLNELGYGKEGSHLTLNLVYNPVGPHLPPAQNTLEEAYKKQLRERYNVEFTRLYTLANMPIQRFGSTLISKGQFEQYMQLLKDSFNSATVQNVMCRTLLSVDWQGYVYDCDFNQMLKLPAKFAGKPKVKLSELLKSHFAGNPIVVMDHCYGCTAGQGSSCGGALE